MIQAKNCRIWEITRILRILKVKYSNLNVSEKYSVVIRSIPFIQAHIRPSLNYVETGLYTYKLRNNNHMHPFIEHIKRQKSQMRNKICSSLREREGEIYYLYLMAVSIRLFLVSGSNMENLATYFSTE